jgi:predicted  nucleic acid-binding Zn-ribbon protein
MNDLLQHLLELQAMDFDESTKPLTQTAKQKLRAMIPPPILAHYDRLVVRGKKGVALVRNQCCTGCHMRLPIGTINTLMQGKDFQLCDSCGRYLSLAPGSEIQPEAQAPAVPEKPKRKTRKRKEVLENAV